MKLSLSNLRIRITNMTEMNYHEKNATLRGKVKAPDRRFFNQKAYALLSPKRKRKKKKKCLSKFKWSKIRDKDVKLSLINSIFYI